MEQRGVVWGLMVIVVTLFLIPIVLAPTSCVYDSDCFAYGETYICDPELGVCVDLTALDDSPDDDLSVMGDVGDSTTNLSDFDDPLSEGISSDDFETMSESSNMSNTSGEFGDESEPSLEDQIEVLQNRFVVLDSRVSSLEAKDTTATLNDLQSQYIQLKAQVESLNSQVQMITFNTQQNLDSALAGLATLQEELTGTQSQLSDVEKEIAEREAKAAQQRFIALTFVAILVFIAILYYVFSHKKGHLSHHSNVHPQVSSYITSAVGSGKRYSQIQAELLKNGWSKSQIKETYDQITQENYNNYLHSQGKSSGKAHFAPHQTKKIIGITAITIVILGIFIFFVSNAVGQAYYTGISEAEFSVLAKNMIEENIENNLFYETVEFADICVQITEGELSQSYRIIKTPMGNSITLADRRCDANPMHDFAVKFTNWNTFKTIIGGVNCATITAAHATKGVFVLPSKYVASGFSTTSLGSGNFCSTLRVCANQLPVATVLGSLGC